MPAAVSQRRSVLIAAGVAYAAVFSAFALIPAEVGLGHMFYIPVALVALVTSPLWGAAAGALAALLYCLGVVAHAKVPSADIVTTSTLIRLLTYSATGITIELPAIAMIRFSTTLATLRPAVFGAITPSSSM